MAILLSDAFNAALHDSGTRPWRALSPVKFSFVSRTSIEGTGSTA